MPATSSATIGPRSATFDQVIDVPDLAAISSQFTIVNEGPIMDTHDGDVFTVRTFYQHYKRTSGDIKTDRCNLVLTSKEFMQLLTMITDFASANGFTPTILPAP
jgi:hypothetical protein